MHPILFEVPGLGFPVRSFGVMVAAGFLLGTQLWSWLLRRYGKGEEDVERGSVVAMWVLAGVLIGARLMYVIVEVGRWIGAGSPDGAFPGADWIGEKYVREPWTILFIWEGGLVMYGGMFGAILLGLRAMRRTGLHPWKCLDLAMVSSFLGLGIGRIGCLLVGDDFGSIVPEKYKRLPFPLTIHVPPAAELHPDSLFLSSQPPVAGEVLWATQPWMSFNAFVIAAVGFWLLKRRRYAGQAALWMTLMYSISRFTIERFRGDEIRGLWFGGALSTSQLISLVVGTGAVALLLRNRSRRDDLSSLDLDRT